MTPTQALEIDLILRATARTEIMPRFRRFTPADIQTKSSPLDLVTTADTAAELMITKALHARYPTCLVVGEEATTANPTLLTQLATAPLAFVVDPIDGTSNYAAGLPLFGTMAAAIEYGQVTAAIIHDPILDTSSIAVRGQGAWEQSANGTKTPLQVAPPVPVHQMTGAASWRYMPADLRTKILPNLKNVAQSYDFRCAAHQYRLLAAGHCDYLIFNRLLPWDHAPGWLLHQEAGGFSAHFDATPYAPATMTGGLICTSDEASFLALRYALMGE